MKYFEFIFGESHSLFKNHFVKSNIIFDLDHIIEYDRGSFDQKSLDQNCVLSVDRNFHNQLTEFFETFHLIVIFNNEFDQTPKN